MIRKLNRKAKALAVAAAKLAGERHCTDIVVLDLRKVSQVTDYFVILTGTSDRQMRSVADEITDIAKKQKIVAFRQGGLRDLALGSARFCRCRRPHLR